MEYSGLGFPSDYEEKRNHHEYSEGAQPQLVVVSHQIGGPSGLWSQAVPALAPVIYCLDSVLSVRSIEMTLFYNPRKSRL
jgi:hypothetical protein